VKRAADAPIDGRGAPRWSRASSVPDRQTQGPSSRRDRRVLPHGDIDSIDRDDFPAKLCSSSGTTVALPAFATDLEELFA
jgi:hypothetical protein